jgi:phosphodiesterase/alkaline phosphatase D-like protein
MVGVGALADEFLASGGRPPGSIATRHRRHGPAAADFSLVADRVGWGGDWFLPAFEREWEVRSGRALLHLARGSRGTAPAQPFPVFFHDHDCVRPDQEIVFRVSNRTLRPGLVFAAVSLWEFMAVTFEGRALVLAEYGRTGRDVVARHSVGRMRAGLDYRLRVRALDRRIMAKVWSDGGSEPPRWQIDMRHRAGHGSVGVIAVAPANRQPARLAVARYQVSSRAFAATPARLPVLITGPPQQHAAGSEVIIRACADRPCSLRFEWSHRADLAELLGSTEDRPASEPPWSASHTIAVSDQRPVYWRAVARRQGTSTTSPAQMVILPSATRPLVLAAASCAQLWQAAPYLGLSRLEQAASPARVAMLAYEGDIGYPGTTHASCYLSAADTFADRFKRMLADPHFQALRTTVPTAFILDDHDYGPPNNADRTTLMPWAAPLWDHFHAEPTGRGYLDGRFGDTHWITLDGRRYCDPITDPDTAAKTKLGREQRGWLERTLAASDAALFVIFSADIFASRTVPDCWPQGWPNEYSDLMTLFMDYQLAGRRVVILSGDAHGMRVHYHRDPRGRPQASSRPVVEFVCSGLRARTWSMNLPNDRSVDPARRVEGKSGLGMISIDPPSAPTRAITLRAIAGDAGQIDLFPPLTVPFAPI